MKTTQQYEMRAATTNQGGFQLARYLWHVAYFVVLDYTREGML
jgi:hypothetical protein